MKRFAFTLGVAFTGILVMTGINMHQSMTIATQRDQIRSMYYQEVSDQHDIVAMREQLRTCMGRAKKAEANREKELNIEYALNNKNSFDDRLPKDTKVVLKTNLFNKRDEKLMASTLCIPNTTGAHCTIWVDPEMNPAEATASMTLYHEQCHIRTWGAPGDPHGASFQTCMMSLALHEAFRDLW